ncbi:MAG: glycosyltransferase family 4 protein [Chloroflexi bacterium]|nr:glycosyltransferase family 1 protein [Chloroflexota bacterium]NOG76243.1 glycosyltransferase family 4 protein [Chloroflexota bacterium]
MKNKKQNRDKDINKNIKVLHIFPPNFKTRFGGQIIFWKGCFSLWDNPEVTHLVLEPVNGRLMKARDAFDFEYPSVQRITPIWERIVWLFKLFYFLNKNKKNIDILHLHLLWWWGLLASPWAKWQHVPALYESILLEADTPSNIIRERFGKFKVWCLKNLKAVLAISPYLAEDYVNNGFPSSKIFTLINYVDDNIFFPVRSLEEKKILRKRYNLPLDAIILIFVGSVKERKGADVLIEAFIQASLQYPNLYLLIVGPNQSNDNPSLDKKFIDNLYFRLKESNLLERVLFSGFIKNRMDLACLYQASDMFVFPSRNEGLGNVVLEAMACGMPVVVSRLPVLEGVVQHEHNGLLVPIGDSQAVQDNIVTLINTPTLARELGESARNVIQQAHTFQNWQINLIRFYKSLL